MFFTAPVPGKARRRPPFPLSFASKWVTGSSGMSLHAPSVGVGVMASVGDKGAVSSLTTASFNAPGM